MTAWNTVPHELARRPREPGAPRSSDRGRTARAGAGRGSDRLTLAQLYLGVRGRIARRTYWLHGVLSLLLLGIVVNALLAIANVDNDTAGKLVNLVFLWPLIAVSAKRQHDFDFSAWWALIHFIPGVGSLVLLLVDGSVPGTPGPNRFGPRPRS